jgi:hypothetical protein
VRVIRIFVKLALCCALALMVAWLCFGVGHVPGVLAALVFGFFTCLWLAGVAITVFFGFLYWPTSFALRGVKHAATRAKDRALKKVVRREMGTELLPTTAEQGRGDEACAWTGRDEGQR